MMVSRLDYIGEKKNSMEDDAYGTLYNTTKFVKKHNFFYHQKIQMVLLAIPTS